MYAVDAVTYAVLIVVLGLLHVPRLESTPDSLSLRHQISAGVRYVRTRRIIWMLMSLDLTATLFGAYRVVLPALATDVLDVGATGYGLLAAAPSAGALLSTHIVFRTVDRSPRLGRVLLVATVGYGLAVAALGQAWTFPLALVAAALIGGFDAMATSIRHAAVQLETPDRLRGRVSSIYQMSSRGGPALGDALVGAVAGVVGPAVALFAGGLVASAYACSFLARPNVVREYAGVRGESAEDHDEAHRRGPAVSS
jgi:MFS family permease